MDELIQEWIAEGNACEVRPGVWKEQTTQWKKEFTYLELQEFFKREYM